jgi:hypothetical protein
VVTKDVGGLVSSYVAQTERYRAEGREVRLHECRSACTLALSLPGVCVYPSSVLKFHQAYNQITRETDHGISRQMFESYPKPVQARLGGLTRDYRVLGGAELISLGIRNCEAKGAPKIPQLQAHRRVDSKPANRNIFDWLFSKAGS